MLSAWILCRQQVRWMEAWWVWTALAGFCCSLRVPWASQTRKHLLRLPTHTCLVL